MTWVQSMRALNDILVGLGKVKLFCWYTQDLIPPREGCRQYLRQMSAPVIDVPALETFVHPCSSSKYFFQLTFHYSPFFYF